MSKNTTTPAETAAALALMAETFPACAPYIQPASIPTQEQYERQERARLQTRLQQIETAPLADRKEARADWADMMLNPALVGERVSWVLDGSYGWAEQERARAIRANKRGNRAAAMGQLLAALDCQCPARFAAEAWGKLTAAQASAVDSAILTALDAPEEE